MSLPSLSRQYIGTAEAHLSAADARLARLIAAHAPCTLGTSGRDPFQVLVTSIISQQLSTKAADTIQSRIEVLIGTPGRLAPEALLAVTPQALRGVGLSNAKAGWLQELSRRVLSGALSFGGLALLDDEAALAELDALPGVGRWTAEMMLIFALHRLDVFSMGDVGLRRAVNRLYNGGEPLADDATRQITAIWAPYRSVASWYLWRLTDGNVQAWSEPSAPAPDPKPSAR